MKNTFFSIFVACEAFNKLKLVTYIFKILSIETMNYLLVILTSIISHLAFGQAEIPDFLQGTWKMENKEIYEHWDKLNDKTLKGFSYKLNNGQMKVSEYLEIKQHDNHIVYTASVINQNQGKSVDFKLIKTDSTFTFENPNHDFPKQIVYQKLSDTEIFVQVSDGNEKGFAYKMTKQNSKKGKEHLKPIYNKN